MMSITQPAVRMYHYKTRTFATAEEGEYTVLYPIFAIEAFEDGEINALYLYDSLEIQRGKSMDGRIGKTQSNLMLAPWPASEDRRRICEDFNKWCFSYEHCMYDYGEDEPETPTP